MYDHGDEENMEASWSLESRMLSWILSLSFFFVRNDSTTLDHPQIYGQPEPLPWLLEEVNVPVSLYWGQNDWLSAIEDYTRMQDEVRFTKIGIHVMAK